MSDLASELRDSAKYMDTRQERLLMERAADEIERYRNALESIVTLKVTVNGLKAPEYETLNWARELAREALRGEGE